MSSSMTIIHAPRIHLNGTGKAQLIGAYETALDAVDAAFKALRDTAPNGRDYYTDAGSMTHAEKEHRDRLLACDNLKSQLDAIIGAIDTNEVIATVRINE